MLALVITALTSAGPGVQPNAGPGVQPDSVLTITWLQLRGWRGLVREPVLPA